MTHGAPGSSKKPARFAGSRTLWRAGIALLCVLLVGIGPALHSRYATPAAPIAPPAASTTTAGPATAASVSTSASEAPAAAASISEPAPAATGAVPQAAAITSAAAPSLDDIEHRTFEFFWQTANP